MKKYYRYLLSQVITFICIILASTLSYAQTPAPFSKITIFGDSLSDNGNLYYYLLGFLPKSPPYYQGRFSNGPAWSEFVDQYYLNKNSVQTVNYAVGGQTTILHNPLDGFLPYTLTMSLDSYLLRTAFQDRSQTLFIVWIGANDYLPGVKKLDELSSNVVGTIKTTIESLIYYGGKNFLVLNLPDLAKTPYARSSTYEADLKAATTVHNLKLDGAVADIQNNYKGVKIELFNSNSLLTDFIDHIDTYNQKYNTHINNTTASCWKGGYTFAARKNISEAAIAQQIEQSQQSKSFTRGDNKRIDSTAVAHYIATSPSLLESYNVGEGKKAGLERCSDPDDYLFWDGIHPTAVMHMMISKNVIEFIDKNYTSAASAG